MKPRTIRKPLLAATRRRRALHGPVVAAGLFAAAAFPSSAHPASATQAFERSVIFADLAPHEGTDGAYVETWTYEFYLDGGLQLSVRLSRADVGSLKDDVAGADLSIDGFGGRSYRVVREYPIENFTISAETREIRVHQSIFAKGDLGQTHRLHFETSKNDISYVIDLTLSDIVPGLWPGDAANCTGREDCISVVIHIPYAKVDGTVSVNGDERAVSGTAYMDQLFVAARIPKLVCCGLRYVAHGRDWEVGYLLLAASQAPTDVIGYGLRSAGNGIEPSLPQSFTILSQSKSDGVKLADRMEVAYLPERRLHLERTRIVGRASTFDDVRGWLKPFARGFLGGEVLFIRATGTIDGSRPAFFHYLAVR